MVIIATALLLCVLLGFLLVIPRYHNFDRRKKVQSSSDDHKVGAELKLLLKVSRMISRSEVSLHNRRTDCWIIIKEKVYDVISYVEEHPGGDAILSHAGDDSTEGFYGPQHATRVFDMIGDFCIGDLEQ